MTAPFPRFDIVVIGAGMAGASLGAQLAGPMSVLLIEQEQQPGYHATGRSVAFWSESYGGPQVRPLTRASFEALAHPEPDFAERPFLSARGALHIGRADNAALRDAMVAEFADASLLRPVDGEALAARIPGLRPGWTLGLAEDSTADIDVAAYHAACLARFRKRGGTLWTDAALAGAERAASGDWTLQTRAGTVRTGIVVNAAGAWADPVARLCGVTPLGIAPLLRNVVQLRTDPAAPADLPLVLDLAGSFYFKPAGVGRIWLTPHDELPSAPCDAAPDDIAIATAIARFEQVVDWKVAAVERKWAGLRSFAPDRLPVIGFDRAVPGFFWFAGQGGFGIQTAPANAMLAGALLTGGVLDDSLNAVDPDLYAPARFG